MGECHVYSCGPEHAQSHVRASGCVLNNHVVVMNDVSLQSGFRKQDFPCHLDDNIPLNNTDCIELAYMNIVGVKRTL